MITLIIDTSTDKSLIALAKGDEVLLKIFLPQGGQSSRYLMQEVEKGFKELNMSPAELQAVGIGVGPGSYTGIRVGVAAAKGLCFAKSLPLIGFCSLEGFITDKEGPFASLIDARIGGYYVLLQEMTPFGPLPISKPELVAKTNLEEHLKDFPIRTGPHATYPDADHLAKLVAKKLVNGEGREELDLLYLRTPVY